MTEEQKKNLVRELYENTDLTKEQYIELCKLCEELDLTTDIKDDPGEPSWDDILNK